MHTRHHHHIAGLSLIELLCVLAIMTIMTGYAVPSVQGMLTRSKATTSINWIIGVVNFTRHSAIQTGVLTTVCPSSDGASCGGKWHQGVIVFMDFDGDAELDSRDRLLQRIMSEDMSGTLKWRAFRNRQYLQMTPAGYTNYQNGNFVYCPHDGNLKYARQIVINVQGRARVLHSKNEEGIAVDRKGKPLRC